MATRLFNLRNVPDDEANEVRALLADHQIDITETKPGFMGIGSAAIWVVDKDNVVRAQALLDAYQEERAQTARQTYLQAKQEGTAPTPWDLFMRDPFRVVVYLLALCAILYFMVVPFFHF